jgi:hypothetical protein
MLGKSEESLDPGCTRGGEVPGLQGGDKGMCIANTGKASRDD